MKSDYIYRNTKLEADQMEDKQIVELFWERNESALSEVSQKYGRFGKAIANNIIGDYTDAEECFNDVLLAVWNSLPPNKPDDLRAYIGKIVRRSAINTFRKETAQKRGGKEIQPIFDELAEFSSDYSVEAVAEQHEIIAEINTYLKTLSERKQKVFILRYWHCCEVSEISAVTGYSEANVYSILTRERKKLLDYLRKRGVLN